MHAAQCWPTGSSTLRKVSDYPATPHGLRHLIAACTTRSTAGGRRGTNLPLGLAAFTVAWFSPEEMVHIFHAGNTVECASTAKRHAPHAPRPRPSGIVNYSAVARTCYTPHPCQLTAARASFW